jgi:hypothetical protein
MASHRQRGLLEPDRRRTFPSPIVLVFDAADRTIDRGVVSYYYSSSLPPAGRMINHVRTVWLFIWG